MPMPRDRLSATDTGRLAIGDRELHAGDPIELMVHHHWYPARVEWDGARWYAVLPQGVMGQALHVPLWPGLLARLPEGRR